MKCSVFFCLVSLALGGKNSEHDIDIKASLTVKKDLIPDKPLNYLNNKISELLGGLQLMPVLRMLRAFFTPKIQISSKDHKVVKQSNKALRDNRAPKLDLWKFIRHFNKKGKFRLSQAFKDFSKILRAGHSPDMESDIKTNYKKQMHKFINDLLLRRRKTLNTELDKQLTLIDVIENCHRSMLIEGAGVWNKMSVQYRSQQKLTSDRDTNTTMLSEFVKGSLLHKIHDYGYLCNETKVCRSFPGYFDYFGDILEQIISISDINIHKFIIKNINIFKNRTKRIEMIFSIIIRKKIDKLFQKLIQKDAENIRKLLASSDDFIKHRRFWKSNMDTKNKLTRVLLDMVDKSFAVPIEQRIRHSQFVHNELENEFSYLLTALEQVSDWVSVESAVVRFVDYTLKTINQAWDQYTRREATTIMEVLLEETISYNETYTNLLYSGSQYLCA